MQKTPGRVRARVLALFATVLVALVAVGGRTSVALADTWTVSYGAGGGAGAMTDQVVALGSSTVVKDNAFTRTGYSFAGWNTVSDGSGESYRPGERITSSVDVRLHAMWNANGDSPVAKTISFDGNGGKGSMGVQTVYQGVGAALHPNTFQYKGHTFKGWSTVSSGAGDFYVNGETVYAEDNLSLYAVWDDGVSDFNLFYDANGGSGTMGGTPVDAATGTATVSECTLTPPAGEYFIGWKDAQGEIYVPGETVALSGDLVLYAQWDDEPFITTYTVTFNGNGGSGSMLSQTFFEGIPEPLLLNTFTRSGYYFIGWNTNSAGTGTSYTDGQSITVSSDLTLYAQWSTTAPTPSGSYTVRFHLNIGSYDYSLPYTVTSGDTFYDAYDDFLQYIDDYETIWEGRTLVGWSSTKNSSRYQYAYNSTSTIPSSPTDWYAVWSDTGTSTLNNVTIRFQSNYPSGAKNTSGSMSSQTIGTSSTKLNTCNFKCDNYKFKYWTYQSSDSGTHFSDGATVTASTFSGHISGYSTSNISSWYSNSSNYYNNGEVTLYAQWSEGSSSSEHTITFNANGGTGTMSNQTVKDDTSTALKSNAFTRTGYTFDGWNTSANGSGTSYTNGQSVRLTSDLTLYAQWKEGGSTTPTPVTPSTTPTTPTTSTTPTTTTPTTSTTTTPATSTPTVQTIPASTLAATGDSTNYGIIVAAVIAGIGVIVVGMRFRKNSKR